MKHLQQTFWLNFWAMILLWGAWSNNAYAQLTVTASSPNASICANETTTLEVTGVTGGSGNYSYAWTPAASLVDATVANPTTVALTTTTIFEVTVTDDDDASVTGTATVTITVNPRPTVTITPTNATICAGENTTLNTTVAGGTGPYTYL
ncbi:hypothetical protein, partial [Eisenibacter elegans]|uniref:hypothetical protein n=1 Tax=Eisenibacter elegans TaxID=997 RepID=UPI000557D10C